MFIHFEILIQSHEKERVELIVTTPKEAVNLFTVFENSPSIIAWRCVFHRPEDFGCAKGDSGSWKKLRLKGFTREDYSTPE